MNRQVSFARGSRLTALTLAGIAFAGVASAALWADNVPTSVLIGGDFEAAAVSLRLPDVDRFPLVAGGWGARAAVASAVRTSEVAFAGASALEIAASVEAPAHAIQDVPLGTRSFLLEFAVERLRGRQEVLLVADWDRGAPAATRPSLRLEMTAGSLGVATPDGSWDFDLRMLPGRWLEIAVEADARADQTLVLVDGAVIGIVPGVPERAPRTVIVGSDRGRGSLFRYDSFALTRLAEIELAHLEDRLLREAPSQLQAVIDRLDMAADAIEMSASYLAIPELRAAGRLLASGPAQAELQTALADVIALLEAR